MNHCTMTEKSALSFAAVAPYYEHLMSGVPYRFWLKHIEQYWKSVDSVPQSVLDIATGTGTMARLLASQGKNVVGVDISEAMLETARRRAVEEKLVIEWARQDVSELELTRSFDSVICLFDSLNYVLDDEKLRSAFQRIGAHLKSGGTFVFDMNSSVAFELGMFNQSCSRRDEPLHYRWRQRYDQETRICTVRMTFTYRPGQGKPEQTFYEVHRQRSYSKGELWLWLTEAGFGSIVATDSFSDNAATEDTDRLVFKAIKT